ncbi:MAG: hypothetical protein RL148_2440 [Planctomycetota bacterium]
MNLNRPFAALPALLVGLADLLPAQGVPVGFEETYALARDAAARTKALEQLVPGTAEFYYHHCLDAQHRGDFGAVPRLLTTWVERHGRTQQVDEIELRQALLTHERDPAATFEFLRRQFGSRFDAQRTTPGTKPQLPTSLDPALLERGALDARARSLHPNSVDGFRPSAHDALATLALTDAELVSFMQAARQPDLPGLTTLLLRHMRLPNSGGFGSLAVHGVLLLDQLEELARQAPELLGDSGFVGHYVRRLMPPADVSLQSSPAERAAFLDRLWQFAQRLPASQVGFKVHVLQHRLAHDLAEGTLDRERFRSYLRLPRAIGYAPQVVWERWTREGQLCRFGEDFPTGLGPTVDDTGLVRTCLEHFLADESGIDAWREFFVERWLKQVYAEQKLLAGAGDPEQLYSMLDDPGLLQQVKDRVEIAFLPTQRRVFARDEAVALTVDVKNVPKLLVKVFVVDAYAYQRDTGKEVDASIPLDGLIANRESTFEYGEAPIRRVRRTFEFPELSGPGTYVVEFLGNGMSSRAVVTKGSLDFTEVRDAAGHALTVRDEAGNPVAGATVWFAQAEHVADQDGTVHLPYAAQVRTGPVVLRSGTVSSVRQLQQDAEAYQLAAGMYVDRESLVDGAQARLLVRPSLLLNGQPVPLALLESPELEVTALDRDGVPATRTTTLVLTPGAEHVETLQVPQRLAAVRAVVRGKVRNMALGTVVELRSPTASFNVNGIDATAQVSAQFLGRNERGWYLDLRGRNGEPKADRPVLVRLTLRDHVDALDVPLQTDEQGRVQLGELAPVTALEVVGVPGVSGSWPLALSHVRVPRLVHAVEGMAVRIPYGGAARQASRTVFSLFELRGGVPARDEIERVRIAGGAVVVEGLVAGDHVLHLKETGDMVDIRVAAGAAKQGWGIGSGRWLQAPEQRGVHLASVAVDGSDLRVRVGDPNQRTRVHVWATRYAHAWSPQGLELPVGRPLGALGLEPVVSDFQSGRVLGDEYRYILERRYAQKFPGNMLARPGLVLNPWALEEARGEVAPQGGGGGGYGSRGGGRRGSGGPAGARDGGAWSGNPGTVANLDFLPEGARMVANLAVGADGTVAVPIAQLGDARFVHVMVVDDVDMAYRSVGLPERPMTPRPRELRKGMDPGADLAQQRRIEFVAGGGTAVVEDVTTTQWEVFASLADVFRLFTALGKDENLARFAFVLDWPTLSPADKQRLYAAHACHELHFFLHQKDPEFFGSVVKPYLANKLHKKFMDQWLLGEDLSAHLEPWAFSRLNVVEQVLLLQRVGRRADAARLVRERLATLPPDVEREDRTFLAALRSAGLDQDRGLRAEVETMEKKLEEKGDDAKPGRIMAPGAPPPPAAGAAPAPEPEQDRVSARKNMERAKAKAGEVLQDAEERGAETGKDEFFLGATRDKDLAEREQLARRAQVKAQYRAPDVTKRYAESDYWQRRVADTNADLVTVNAFWADYAAREDGKPFASRHFAAATNSFPEMMFALAVLDLPVRAEAPRALREGNRVTLTASTPLLLVRQDVLPARPPTGANEVLLSQNFFRLDDRYRVVDGEQLDRFVTGEFVADIAYGSQVVLTNPTSARRKLDLLLQVPQGSIALQGGQLTKGMPVVLEPYATVRVEYAFYFPAPGTFAHYPAHVSKDGVLVAEAVVQPATMQVVAVATEVDAKSWERVSQDASPEEVLEFLQQANLQLLQLDRMLWRMRDRSFFERATALLRSRQVYHDVIWSYALLHGAAPEAREWLRHQESFVARCGPALRSTLLDIDPVETRWWQLVDYSPLFHARAHQFGKRREILNRDLAGQYGRLLEYLCHVPVLGDEHWLLASSYLALQDRVADARTAFDRVRRDAVAAKLQYDYLSCHLAFSTDDPARARAVAELHRDHPVERWRTLFRTVLAQLDEAEGKGAAATEARDREQRQGELAAAAPMLELAVEGTQLVVRHRNLESFELRFHRTDAEFAFSTNPFVQDGAGNHSWVQPQRRMVVAVAQGATQSEVPVPEEFRNQNLLLEVQGGGIVRRQTVLATAMSVQFVESYGQLVATDKATGKPLPKVYVKVYARGPNGTALFHKDGYTDLRGRFDYASVSESATVGADRYAVLVLSEDRGAVVREVAPPPQ